ncbi:interleukin-9 receptor-like [Macaca nemestrina]|uniref:interleukin-9 receptor-like n=1 Tax=Macaca nemestrina TaxID=9545 RepID=UPI0039B8A1AE
MGLQPYMDSLCSSEAGPTLSLAEHVSSGPCILICSISPAVEPTSLFSAMSWASRGRKRPGRVKRTFYQNVSSPAAFFRPLYSVRNGNFQLSAPTMCLASSFCECVCPVAVGKGLCCVHCPRGSHCLWAPALPGSLVPPDRMPEPHLRSELCTSPSVALLGSHSPGTSEQLGGCIRPSPPCWAGGSCPRVGGAGEGGGGWEEDGDSSLWAKDKKQ